MLAIELKDLRFRYRTESGETSEVLKGAHLSVGRGEFVAIQGPSGSGKSTLLHIVGGLLKGYTGTVRVNGTNIDTLSPEEMALFRNQTIGFVFQQFHLLPKLNVLDNILLPELYPMERRRPTDRREKAVELAETLGLGDKLHSLPNQLSGGQQQRVAIARAMLMDADIVLADEPTGNLDSQNTGEILNVFREANQRGKTIVIITHDSEVAAACDRVIPFRDGLVQSSPGMDEAPPEQEGKFGRSPVGKISWSRLLGEMVPLAWSNLRRNGIRTVLTMLGVIIGVAAVLSMVTVGEFTRERLLESYAELGVHSIVFRGSPNWAMKASDQVGASFQSFDLERDLKPLPEVFPEIELISPLLMSWNAKASFGGLDMDDVRVLGVSDEALEISKRPLLLGKNFSRFHVDHRSSVCIIGYDLYERFFRNVSPIGQVIHVAREQSSYGCRVIGVMESQSSNSQWRKPNLEVYMPHTFMAAVSDYWSSRIFSILMQFHPSADVNNSGDALEAYFEKRYGSSGRFHVGSNSKLIGQMQKFLKLFTLLLGAIAMVSLGVGGVGITNMMLVSVNERFREIGVRKAFGATDRSIRLQYLVESVTVCAVAGFLGLVLGFGLYQGAIYLSSKFVPEIRFQWVLNFPAVVLSVLSIFAVGLLSGLAPAIKAERLQVVEALRSE